MTVMLNEIIGKSLIEIFQQKTQNRTRSFGRPQDVTRT